MKQRYIPYIFLILFLFLLDQITKFLSSGKTIFITEFFSFTYAENTGGAFSIFQNYNFAFILFSFFALFFLLTYFKDYPLPISFILAGLFGNLCDRLFLGFVRDFISVGSFPIFNIADSANTIGVFLLLYVFWKEEKLNKAQRHRRN